MFGFGGFGQPAVAAAVDPGVAALEGEFNKFFSLFGAPSTLTTPPKQATDRTIVEHSAFKVRCSLQHSRRVRCCIDYFVNCSAYSM
jgi:hypothetical protein